MQCHYSFEFLVIHVSMVLYLKLIIGNFLPVKTVCEEHKFDFLFLNGLTLTYKSLKQQWCYYINFKFSNYIDTYIFLFLLLCYTLFECMKQNLIIIPKKCSIADPDLWPYLASLVAKHIWRQKLEFNVWRHKLMTAGFMFTVKMLFIFSFSWGPPQTQATVHQMLF